MRFYDPIINIIKMNFTGQTRDFSKLKKAVSFAFNKRIDERSILNRNSGEGKGNKLKA